MSRASVGSVMAVRVASRPRVAGVTTAPFRLRDVALPAYGPTIVESIGHGAILPVVALQARHLGATVGQAAVVVGLVAVGQLLMSLPAGALVARIGERNALLLTGLVEAAAFAVAWRTTSLLLFAAVVMVTGGAWSVYLLGRQGYVIDAVPVAFRARALSALGGSHRVGLFVGPLLGAAVIDRWGLSSAYALGAVTSLTAAALVRLMPDLGAESRAAQSAAGLQSVRAVLREHRHVLLTLGTAVTVITASRALRVALLPLWCDHIGLSAATTSLVFGVAAALDLSLFYPAGWVMDHHGRTYVALPVVATVAAGVLLLPLTHSFLTVTLVACLVAVGNGLGSGIVMTLGADAAPTTGRAQFLGGWRLCGDVGNSGAPLLLGALTTVVALPLACVVTGLLCVAGTGWVTRWTRELDQVRRSASAPS